MSWDNGLNIRRGVIVFPAPLRAFESDKTRKVPSLGTRVGLARSLANALYWLHHNQCSERIVVFRDRGTGALRLDRPYLIGLQYSRPDDNPSQRLSSRKQKFVFSERVNRNKDFPELYLPAEFASSGQRRYRRSDDVYSMGVMLFEIAS
ncbi:hypothetical protein N0V88_002948 [Collariella sp. IMI 366227]|nr:hypothetical protein N0V88_002948 [Collariella sp. IMI 366227]